MTRRNLWQSHYRTLLFGIVVLGTSGTLLFSRFNSNSTEHAHQENPPSEPKPTSSRICASLKQSSTVDMKLRMSSGERTLFRQSENFNRDRGTTAFTKQTYDEAIQFFQAAVRGGSNDPESQIYLNNAQARLHKNPYLLAAVIPVTNQGDVAKEILRGVADAQTRFNQRDDNNARLLEIVLFDDGDLQSDDDATNGSQEKSTDQIAAQVACQIATNQNILAVIGHNSSDASRDALPVYEESKLAMVSPTATSTLIKSPVFFRTAPSDHESGTALADYALKRNLDRMAVFYTAKSSYSQSLAQEFTRAYEQAGGKVVYELKDLTKPNLDGKQELEKSINQGAQAVTLFPSADIRSLAVDIIGFNGDLSPEKQLQVLGGDTLYHPGTLTNGGNAVVDLVVPAPCPFLGTSYTEDAEQRWRGQISWRTSCSFDATQAIIEAIKTDRQGINRETILEELRKIKLDPTSTSGNPLEFELKGNRKGEPILVQAVPDGARPFGSQFGFKPIP